MIEPLQLAPLEAVPSPALVFDRERLGRNLRRMLAIAGTAARLRPHFKTHKTREILQLESALGITKHKCATLAEAEVLAQGGAASVLLAYPLVGPNVARYVELLKRQPGTAFIALADAAETLDPLADACRRAGLTAEVAIDVDVGQRRTGAAPGAAALALAEEVARRPEFRFGGAQLYDGHNTAEAPDERRAVVSRVREHAAELRDALKRKGLPCPRLVFGGTPAFMLHAELEWPEAECSPGTCVLHDFTYARKYPELGFETAAQVLTRLISRPAPNRFTFDLGTKALASDPPLEQRAALSPPLSPCGEERDWGASPPRLVLHNEEHLVVETHAPLELPLGSAVWATPGHVCPTVALHERALVVEGGKLVGAWPIAARHRRLSWEA